jgi:hypothetical protein
LWRAGGGNGIDGVAARDCLRAVCFLGARTPKPTMRGRGEAPPHNDFTNRRQQLTPNSPDTAQSHTATSLPFSGKNKVVLGVWS